MYSLENIYQLYIECEQKVCTDSRKIIPGSIFFALKGNNFDGNLFALQSLENGCKYAVVDNSEMAEKHPKCIYVSNVLKILQQLANYHRKKINLPVIAITGSNGKTTTKELVAKVLSQKYNVLSTPGNFNNHIGLPLTLLQLKKEHEIAVIEMGANHPGEIKELCEIAEPNYGVITSIGKEHLEGFGSIENVIKTNGELYDYLLQNNGKIFLHLDNKDLLSFLAQYYKFNPNTICSSEQIICYSEISQHISPPYTGREGNLRGGFFPLLDNPQNPIILGNYIENNNDIFVHFQWIVNQKDIWEEFQQGLYGGHRIKPSIIQNTPIVKTHLLAYHNFLNALCAVSIGYYFGVEKEKINSAIENYIPDKNRMQWIETEKGNKIILDAYNANPTSMMAALEFFKSKNIILKKNILSTDKDKVLILGDMFELGEHSKKEHKDILNFLINNFQESEIYLAGKEFLNASRNIKLSNNIQIFSNTQELLKTLSQHHPTNKFFLIKASRGMQLEQCLNYL